LTQLGDTALAVKDMKKAQQMFRALLLQRLDDSSPITKAQVFCRLGQVHKELGETAKAKQMFERALQTDKNLEEAQQGLAEL
jgi:tetratricopeptide (TPR) repeat protein